jgi:hypothetical protein
MSSNPISDAQNLPPPPPPKKGKTNNGKAAAAVVAATNNNENAFAALAARVAELENNYVSKEELENNYVSKEEHEKTQEELSIVKARVDHSAEALAPATQYALMETAISTFVSPVIPSSFILPKDKDKVSYAVSLVCRVVLTSFLFPDKTPTFSWQGPSRMTGKNKSVVLRHGLVGLVSFIDSQDDFDLVTWDPQARHDFLHNGRFLDAYYGTPKKRRTDSSDPSYSVTKKDVKEKRTKYTENASSLGVNVPMTVAAAVALVVTALEVKSIEVDANFVDETVKGINHLI